MILEISKTNRKFWFFYQKNRFFQENVCLKKSIFLMKKSKFSISKKIKKHFFFRHRNFQNHFSPRKNIVFRFGFFFWTRNFLYLKDLCLELSGEHFQMPYHQKCTIFPKIMIFCKFRCWRTVWLPEAVRWFLPAL